MTSFFDPNYEHLIGAVRDGKHGLEINMNTGNTVANLPLPGMPHLGSGITWEYQGTRVMATPHFRTSAVSIIDMDTWKVIKTLETAGSGFFMRSHENSRYGKKLPLSIWDEEGAVIVYDADRLEEEKRIPMNKPSGKYNV